MRILFVSKRRPQQRDLLDRPYGRFHYLPVELAARGHDVVGMLVSHQGLDSECRELSGVCWISHDLRRHGPFELFKRLVDEAAIFKPEVVVGCSDAWCGWIAHRLAVATRARLMIDAYDNYEAYMPWNLPLHMLWRRAVKYADLVTAAGPQLALRLQAHRSTKSPVKILPMAADPGFMAMPRQACRDELALPGNPSIGYFGGWARSRGTRVLFDAFQKLHARRPEVRLILSGHPPTEVRNAAGVIALGYLPDEAMPKLLNAVDVACVIAANTSFGRFSYPSKLCEAMACGTSVVASATAPIGWMLGNDPRYLVPPADADSLAERMEQRLGDGKVQYGPLPTWDAAGIELDKSLRFLDRDDAGSAPTD